MNKYRIVAKNDRYEIEKFDPETDEWVYMADRFSKMLAKSYIRTALKLEKAE